MHTEAVADERKGACCAGWGLAVLGSLVRHFCADDLIALVGMLCHCHGVTLM